ncbi:MAG: hypothetical protein HY690_21050 [Chloroflexi bacterium]|nr:hypothetical protein [Chloroflexota bacterium]
MKLLILLVVLGVAGYLLRRRLKLALGVAAVFYLGITLYRLAQVRDGERLLGAAANLAIFGLAWLLLWAVVRAVELRRARARARRNS